jgi:hypothetical protein
MTLRAPLLLLLCALAPARGVQTEQIESRGFRVHFTPRAAGLAGPLATSLEQRRVELAQRIGRDWAGTVEVYLADGPEEVQAIAPEGVHPPPWAAALAVPGANALLFDARILRGDEGKQIVTHELAHLALGRLGKGVWPRWFQEGFAMLVAGEWSVSRYAAIYRATVREAAIPLAALSDQWPERLSEVEIAYAQSFSFVASLYDERGEAKLRELIARVADGTLFPAAFAGVYGVTLERAEADWRTSLAARYSWVPILTGTGTLWLLITAIFLYAYTRVRRRRRERLEAMELEEQAREAAIRIVAAEAIERPGELPQPPVPSKRYLN